MNQQPPPPEPEDPHRANAVLRAKVLHDLVFRLTTFAGAHLKAKTVETKK